jgi:hypothetical protein
VALENGLFRISSFKNCSAAEFVNFLEPQFGWVYAFANASMPGIAKIGAANREVAARLQE